MRRILPPSLSVLLLATTMLNATGVMAAPAAHGRGFKTEQPSMLTPVMAGVTITPLLTVGDVLRSGYRFEAVPDGISLAHTSQGNGRALREPRDEQGPVPVQHGRAHRGQRGERLRQRAGEPPDPRPALGRGAQRLVRHLEQLRLPALLLQLPRDVEGVVRSADPLHERGVARLRASTDGLVAAGTHELKAEGGRRRRRARCQDRRAPADLRDGQAQPREQRRDPRVWETGRLLRRRHVHERASDGSAQPNRSEACTCSVAALLVHRTEHEIAAGRSRATCGPSSPTRPA